MALAVTQSVHVEGTSVTNVTTPSMTTVAGRMLHASIHYYGGSIFTSLTDNDSLTWTETLAEHGNTNIKQRARYNTNITGKVGHTFTLTLSAAEFPSLGVTEISGQDPAGAFDVSNGQTQAGGTPHISPNIVTTRTNTILIGMGMSEAAVAGVYTVGSGWTEVINQETTASLQGLLVGRKIVAATGIYNFEWTSADNSGDFVSGIVAYAESGTPIVRNAALPIETLFGVRRVASLPVESLQGVRRAASLSIEWLVSTLTLPDTWTITVPLSSRLTDTWLVLGGGTLSATLRDQWTIAEVMNGVRDRWDVSEDLRVLASQTVQRPVVTVDKS